MSTVNELEVDPEFLAELERRTTILPDGRKIINLENIMARYIPPNVDPGELISELLAEVRRERDAHFDEEWPEIFPAADENGKIELASKEISLDQVVELRARLQSFAEDWESEEMSIYDGYDAAKSQLEKR